MWGHPELWNDDGTGGMYLPTLFQMVMRGVDGVGSSGDAGAGHGPSHGVAFPDERSGGTRPKPGDPRSGGAGKTSVLRAAYEVFRQYGRLTAEAANADRVAIVVSTRMQRIEVWDGRIGGAYFDSLFEAYNACLYAHRPASFVFTEDATAESLRRFDAVLVVGQRVRLDPELEAALRGSGVPVYYDGGSRADLLEGFTPLPVTFDQVEQDPSAMQDDAAYERFRRYFLAHAAELRKAWDAVVAPVAVCDDPEVLLSERVAGRVRYVWAVDNAVLDLSPGLAWRVGLLMTHRAPLVTKLRLTVPPGHRVIDLLAGEVVPHHGGEITTDLRTVPARLYAIAPAGHRPPAQRLQERFGPHVRDVAIAADGRTAALSCFNWDHNLYGVDLATGRTTWRRRIGHHFASAPKAVARGFAAQGYDLTRAEGYHLYLLDRSGTPTRRFALFGLPKRATDWAVAEWGYDTGINNFAVAPGGSWVATSGDLGLVVFDRAGGERWSREWWADRRTPHRLLALDDSTLLTMNGTTATALRASDGSELWSLTFPGPLGGAVGGGRTVALWSDTDGGRLYVVRDGALRNTIPASFDEIALSADGEFLVTTRGRRLEAFAAGGGLLWTFTGDDLLRRPAISPDGARVAVGSELGTLTVLTRFGDVVAERDVLALPVPAWLPGGDLLVATWMGRVIRFAPGLRPRWERLLAPTETDARAKLLAPEPTPTTRKTGWGNAAPAPLPLTPNLLTDPGALIYNERLTADAPAGRYDWQYPVDLLRDGKAEPPPGPWLPWHAVGSVDSGWFDKLAVVVDAFHTRLRVTGITLAEDPAHPESWLRDVRVQWWDAAAERWRDGPYLLSDAALHSHVLETPLEAARFRFVSTGGGAWPAGNLRLGELVFHGEALGCSHPDAVAGRGLAVLFDEQESDLRTLIYPGRPFTFSHTDAYAGSKSLQLTAAGETGPAFVVPFGHAVPNWDFEIAETPRPGQYRYLQFAWKPMSEATTGMSLLIGRPWPGGGVAVSVGDAAYPDHAVIAEHRLPGPPAAGWTKVVVDLWAVTGGNPPRVRCLGIKSTGGGALFDQLVLGRDRADLPG
ncbi:PQQ-binding-like beta-propeller repeat protein [Nonomuraea sp. NPDC050643]|uniref:outer membrane protein assembly factor BamB family protein n=1 Tax=Nonomuraea sp. NPDC050643 TaxID=3155660 RepID=UPI0033E6D125